MEMEVEENTCFNETIEEEKLEPQVQEEQVVTNEENELIDEDEKQDTFKLHQIDTETVIKNEMKQLIFMKVSEETNTKALKDTAYEIEEQISNLKTKEQQIIDKNKSLEEEVEKDKSRLAQSEAMLTRTAEIIDLLKDNIVKLEQKFKESKMQDLLQRTKRIHKNFEVLKNESSLEKKNEKVTNTITKGNDRNSLLMSELKLRQEILEDLKKRQDEIKHMIRSFDNDLEKYLAKEQLLEEKLNKDSEKNLDDIRSKQELEELDQQLKVSEVEKQNNLEKCNSLIEQKSDFERQVRECADEIQCKKNNISKIENNIEQRKTDLENLKIQLQEKNNKCQKTVEELQQHFDNTTHHLKKLILDIFTVGEHNNQLYNTLNEIKADYIRKSEEKQEWIDSILKQKQDLHKFEMELLQKKMENDIKRNKIEETQKKHEELSVSLKSLSEEIERKQRNINAELEEQKTKYEHLKNANEKHFNEMKKKNDYSQATCKYLEEKSENLRQEVLKFEEQYNRLQEENKSLKEMIAKKKNTLEEFKRKLNSLKKSSSETQNKSELNSSKGESTPKKVKFNDVLSFKSPTESTETSIHTPIEKQLEMSFHEWLEDIKCKPDKTSQKENQQ